MCVKHVNSRFTEKYYIIYCASEKCKFEIYNVTKKVRTKSVGKKRLIDR